MAIKNSIRNVLIGIGTAGLRGGTASQTLQSWMQVDLNLPHPLNCGKWRVKTEPRQYGHGTLSAVTVVGYDNAGQKTLLDRRENLASSGGLEFQYWTGLVELCGDFQSDLQLVRIVASGWSYNVSSPPGTFDFEIWGTTNAGGG